MTQALRAVDPTVPWALQKRLVWLLDASRGMGIHLEASKGAGKSRFLGRVLAWQDLVRGGAQVIIDPNGGSIDNLLDKVWRLPQASRAQLTSRLLYVNMSGAAGCVVPFPFYFRFADESLYAIAQRYLDVVRRLDPFLETASVQGWNALWRLGTNLGMALAGLGLQITEADELLARPEYWAGVLAHAAAEEPELAPIAAYFREELPPLDPAQLLAWRGKTMLFRLDPTMRAMFGAATPGIDWGRVVAEGWTVLLDFRDEHDLERLRLKVLWAYRYLLEFLERRGPGRHRPVSLVIDELSYLLSLQTLHGSLLEAELDTLINRTSRAYGIWLTICHQELAQLPEGVQANVMSMGTQILGSTSNPETARALARHFLRFDPYWVKKREPMYSTSYGLTSVIDYHTVEYSLDEQVELGSRLFLELPRYKFLVAIAPTEGTMGTTLRRLSIARLDQGIFVHEPRVAEARAQLMQRSGRPIPEVRAEIDRRLPGRLGGPQPASVPIRVRSVRLPEEPSPAHTAPGEDRAGPITTRRAGATTKKKAVDK